jgi:hypothetical protein
MIAIPLQEIEAAGEGGLVDGEGAIEPLQIRPSRHAVAARILNCVTRSPLGWRVSS